MDRSDRSVSVAEPNGRELYGSRDAKEGATPCTFSETAMAGAVPVMDMMSAVRVPTSPRLVLKVTIHVYPPLTCDGHKVPESLVAGAC